MLKTRRIGDFLLYFITEKQVKNHSSRVIIKIYNHWVMLVLLPLLTRWFFLFSIQMENNYSVYQHVTPDGMYYFGQTQNVKKRWSNNGAGYKGTALYPYIEKFGWDNIQHIVLFRDQTKENALWIENFLIETAREDGVCINKNRSGNVSKEEDYYRDYEQKRSEKRRGYQREYYREYREKNRDKLIQYQREYQQEYYEKNRDKLIQYQREYREQNKDKFRKYQREYKRQRYQRKKEEKQFRELGYVPLF